MAVAIGALALLPPAGGCASVLGVDKTYTLIDGGETDGSFDTGSAEVGTIRCAAGAPCAAVTEECCMSGSHALTCASATASDPCPQGTDIRCDDASDCPGEVCCLQLDDGNDILGTQCKGTCPTTGGWTELCAPPGSQGGGCTQGTCTVLTVLPQPPLSPSWFYGCR